MSKLLSKKLGLVFSYAVETVPAYGFYVEKKTLWLHFGRHGVRVDTELV